MRSAIGVDQITIERNHSQVRNVYPMQPFRPHVKTKTVRITRFQVFTDYPYMCACVEYAQALIRKRGQVTIRVF